MSELNPQSQAQSQAQSQPQSQAQSQPWSQPPADRSVKIPHLVFGLLFLGIAVVWALVVSDVITEDRLTVIAPGILIAAGVIGLAASLASTRNRRSTHSADQYNDSQYNDSLFSDEQDDHVPSNPEHDDHTQEIR